MSSTLQRTGQWVFSQDIPTDVVVEVGEANFSLHKFMLVAKSNYIRKLIMESKDSDVTRIDLSDIPGGAEMFEKAAKFCYGVSFEITVQNVAALQCAAEFLQMTDKSLSSLSGAIVVLKSCEILLPISRDLGIVRRCVDVVGTKACDEAMLPCRSPPNWWTEELCILNINFFADVLASMKQKGLKPSSLASAIITYTERSLRDLVRDHSGRGVKFSDPENNDSEERLRFTSCVVPIRTGGQRRSVKHQLRRRRLKQKGLPSAIKHQGQSSVSHLPRQKDFSRSDTLISLLRCAVFLNTSLASKNEVEKRISAVLEHVTVDDLLVPSFTYDGERLLDLDSVRRIISAFVEKEKSKKANLVPKSVRKSEDDLYRAVDIFLKAHPSLGEIEREKVCSLMDPLKLSCDARLHASQNKRLPVNIVLHALYYDQLKLRRVPEALGTRDSSLAKENEDLRSELMKMKMYVSDLQNNVAAGASSSNAPSNKKNSKHNFFSSVSKKLGKLNPFRHGSKDTSNIDEDLDGVDITKPRRRRFSIS
ncbi:hypothetical protein Bca52824_004088 [Brassica carinata]|uniref:Root phototropism protein 2 n=1 Tax=Brassica carinata TaxID=52824 RepID=A0A8X7WRC3_BRACI|nr:hypothetical protein Bca52824_004088 [Brassica carinata]